MSKCWIWLISSSILILINIKFNFYDKENKTYTKLSVQLLHHVQLFAIPWTAAYQAFLSINNSLSLLKLMSIESIDAIQPSHPLPSPSPPAFNLSQHQGLFQQVSSSYQVAKVLEFQLQHQSLSMNIWDWFPLGLTGLMILQSKGLSRVFSSYRNLNILLRFWYSFFFDLCLNTVSPLLFFILTKLIHGPIFNYNLKETPISLDYLPLSLFESQPCNIVMANNGSNSEIIFYAWAIFIFLHKLYVNLEKYFHMSLSCFNHEILWHW